MEVDQTDATHLNVNTKIVDVPLSEEQKNELVEKFSHVQMMVEQYVEKANAEMNDILEAGRQTYTTMDKILRAQMAETRKMLNDEEQVDAEQVIDTKKQFYLRHFLKAHAELAERKY